LQFKESPDGKVTPELLVISFETGTRQNQQQINTWAWLLRPDLSADAFAADTQTQ